MLEEDKCLSHRRNASTINLQNPVQKKQKKKATRRTAFTTYILNPEKQNQTYPGKPSYRLTQKRSLLTSQKQLQTSAPKTRWV